MENKYSIEKWKETYIKVIKRTQAALPNTTLVLCEPFLLPFNWSEGKTKSWVAIVKAMQTIVRQLAKEHKTIFVSLQEPFNKAKEKAPAKYWVWDGVHPMPAGHELIARHWIKEVSKKLDFLKNYR
ncbi:lysophospholipase L1-like esterase [Saonia flava]|uniref:Lysophospholipase L1-like esterase n=1 Tax=Saonia flava TaxID=523696 RepID=A0A846QRX8_9FLAO|nr:lysophospholipase L1-like esterase [Saonia flava]